MNPVASRPSSGGFTLIELTISAALMGLILVSGYLCLSSGIASQKLVESRGDTLQTARVALNMMAADLRGACALSKEIQFLGMSRELEGIEADNVDFGTHHYTPRRPGEGDFCQTSYFVAREPGSGVFTLWRRRNPAFGADPLAGGSRAEILRGLRGLKLEYYDGIYWYDGWGDPDGRGKAQASFREKPNLTGFPEAVRITLWVEPAPDAGTRAQGTNEASMVLQTVARLHLAGRSQGSSGSSGSREANPSTSPGSPASKEGGE